MSSVEEISSHIQQAKQQLEESASQAGAVGTTIDTSGASLQAAMESCDQMATTMLAANLEGKAAEINAVKEAIQEKYSEALGRADELTKVVESIAALGSRLEETISQAESLRG